MGHADDYSKPLVYLKLTLMAVFWGGTFIAGRIAAKEVAPFSAAFLRFATASLFLLFLTWKVEHGFPRVPRTVLIPLVLLGLSGVFAYNVFFFKGLQLIHAGRASLIIANNPVFIAFFASVFLHERLSRLKMAGIVLSLTGAVIVISRGRPEALLGGHFGWGECWIFCCVASWVVYSIVGKAVMASLSPLTSVTYSVSVGTVALLLPATLEGLFSEVFNYSTAAWLSILFLGTFGTVLAFIWYYQGIRAIGPTKAGQFINLVPVSAVVLAYFILDEPISGSLLVGGIFVILGVYLANITPGAPEKQ